MTGDLAFFMNSSDLSFYFCKRLTTLKTVAKTTRSDDGATTISAKGVKFRFVSGEDGVVAMFAALLPLPEDKADELRKELLRANCNLPLMNGAAFAEEDGQIVFMELTGFEEPIDETQFADAAEDFYRRAVDWKERLANIVEGGEPFDRIGMLDEDGAQMA